MSEFLRLNPALKEGLGYAGNVIGAIFGLVAGTANTAYQNWGDPKFKDNMLNWAYNQYDNNQSQQEMVNELNDIGVGNLGDQLTNPDYGYLYGKAGI